MLGGSYRDGDSLHKTDAKTQVSKLVSHITFKTDKRAEKLKELPKIMQLTSGTAGSRSHSQSRKSQLRLPI